MTDLIPIAFVILVGVLALLIAACGAFEEVEKADPVWWQVVVTTVIGVGLIASGIYFLERLG